MPSVWSCYSRPRAEFTEVGRIYRHTLVPQAAEVVEALQLAGVEVFIVSGGLKAAVVDWRSCYVCHKPSLCGGSAFGCIAGEVVGLYAPSIVGNPDEKYFDFRQHLWRNRKVSPRC